MKKEMSEMKYVQAVLLMKMGKIVACEDGLHERYELFKGELVGVNEDSSGGFEILREEEQQTLKGSDRWYTIGL